MSHNQKLQQIWEFRKRDDDIDSSSDDSKSSSSVEPVLKKHKLVSNLILPENDETSDIPGCQQNGQLDPGKGVHFELGKASSKGVGLRRKRSGIRSKTKRDSMKEDSNKKRKCSTQDPVSLDDFKIFTESILQDLKIERENMFARMREDMRKLVSVKSITRPTRKKGRCKPKTGKARHENRTESGMKTQNCDGGPLDRSVISSRKTDSNNCYKILEERVNNEQGIEIIRSNEKDKGESLRLSAKKSVYLSNHSDQIVSSSYLALPSVLSESQVEQHRVDSSSRNCNQPGVDGNDTSLNFERENLVIDAINHHGYFSGIQAEEPFGNLAQMGSKNMSCYDQHSTQTSSIGSAFELPLHQRSDNTFNITSQIVLENSSRGNNILGLRMNGGGIRFSGNSHALSDNFAANNFHSHMNYKTDGELATFGTQDLKGGHFY